MSAIGGTLLVALAAAGMKRLGIVVSPLRASARRTPVVRHVLARMPSRITFRAATASDADAMARCRLSDPARGAPDPRVAAYLDGRHHPQQALAPRTAFLALHGDEVVGYIAGHRTERFGYEGELQYLFVAPRYRRRGVATSLLRRLAAWFGEEGVNRVCVNVDPDSPAAALFYAAHGAMPLGPYWSAWEDVAEVAVAPGPPPE
jgi:GNAT superfamily N-acetyltransferase